MKVSIIIPVYNAEKYLEECLESALNQTYPDIEVIAVNDGSTDNSLNILKRYKDRIKIIDKKNGGTASALNEGIRNMTGEWFKWLSADDLLYPNAVEVLLSHAKQLGRDSENCIFYSNWHIIDSSGNTIDKFYEPNLDNLTKFERDVFLLDNFIGNAISGMIHKSIFERCGLFDEKVGFSEDYEFWLRCCLLHDCKLHSIPEFTAMYRHHPSQTTQKKAMEAVGMPIIIKNSILKKLNPSKRKKYQNSLSLWRKKKYSFRRRLRKKWREILFSYFPFSIAVWIFTINVKLRRSSYYLLKESLE